MYSEPNVQVNQTFNMHHVICVWHLYGCLNLKIELHAWGFWMIFFSFPLIMLSLWFDEGEFFFFFLSVMSVVKRLYFLISSSSTDYSPSLRHIILTFLYIYIFYVFSHNHFGSRRGFRYFKFFHYLLILK